MARLAAGVSPVPTYAGVQPGHQPIAIAHGGQHQGFAQTGAGLQQLVELASVQCKRSSDRTLPRVSACG